MSSGNSSGEYSRSASWMTTRSPRTASKPGAQRRALAPILRLEQQREPELALQAGQDVARAVGRAIVDDDQLGAERHREHAPDDLLDRRRLVVDAGMTTDSSGSVELSRSVETFAV